MSSTSPPWRPAAAKAMIAKKKRKSTNFMLIDLYFTFDNLIVAQSPYIEFFGHILTQIETFREFMENFSLELHIWNLKWNFNLIMVIKGKSHGTIFTGSNNTYFDFSENIHSNSCNQGTTNLLVVAFNNN